MPFTLSHPAAVAPLRPLARRLEIPLAALAIGAMAPDFEYLLRLRATAYWGHTLAGLLYFCLPAGMAALLLWERLLRAPVRRLLALPAECRAPEAGRPAAWWGRAAVGVVLGAATHLLWDGFTHGHYWGVRVFPALRSTAFVALGRTVPWFNVLQHLSTVVGGAVVALWLWHRIGGSSGVRRVLGTRWRVATLAVVAFVSLLAGVANGAWSARRGAVAGDYWTVQLVVGRVAVGALVGTVLALVTYAALARRSARTPGDCPVTVP